MCSKQRMAWVFTWKSSLVRRTGGQDASEKSPCRQISSTTLWLMKAWVQALAVGSSIFAAACSGGGGGGCEDESFSVNASFESDQESKDSYSCALLSEGGGCPGDLCTELHVGFQKPFGMRLVIESNPPDAGTYPLSDETTIAIADGETGENQYRYNSVDCVGSPVGSIVVTVDGDDVQGTFTADELCPTNSTPGGSTLTNVSGSFAFKYE